MVPRGQRLGSTLAVLLAVATSVTACQPFSSACPAIGWAPGIGILISGERAAALDLATLTAEACQDGVCHTAPFAFFAAPPSGQPSTAAVPAPGSKSARIEMPRLSESPIDLTVSGKAASGEAFEPLHVRITPLVDYPYGQQCGRRIGAGAILDASGLHSG